LFVTIPNNERTVRFIGFNLFIFFVATYLLTASGAAFSDVAQLRVEVARSLIERMDLNVPHGTGIIGVDGREYSSFGIGSVVLFIPLFLFGKLAGLPPENVASVMNHFFGAATAVLVFFFSISLGYSRRASVLVSMIYGLGTMAWYYSKDSGDHTIETFFILFSIYSMYRYTSDKKASQLILSALSFGFSLTIRPTAILIMPALFILLFFRDSKKVDYTIMISRFAKDVSLFSIALVPFVVLIFWYNHYRFGSLFETGHALMAARLGVDFFSGTSLFTGIQGFLASPGKGFFYYSPVTVLFFFSIRSFSKKNPVTAVCFILLMLSYLLFHSKNIYWHGASGWGPRYLFVLTPFFVIPIAELFDSADWLTRKKLRLFAYTVFAGSLVVQLAAISVNPTKYYYYLLLDEKVKFTVDEGSGVQPIVGPPLETYFDWHRSPILTQFKFIREMALHLHEYTYVQPSKETETGETIKSTLWMNVFDFWWVYRYFMEGSYSGFIVALLLLFISLFSATRAWKAVR
jgi:hypothetical protein